MSTSTNSLLEAAMLRRQSLWVIAILLPAFFPSRSDPDERDVGARLRYRHGERLSDFGTMQLLLEARHPVTSAVFIPIHVTANGNPEILSRSSFARQSSLGWAVGFGDTHGNVYVGSQHSDVVARFAHWSSDNNSAVLALSICRSKRGMVDGMLAGFEDGQLALLLRRDDPDGVRERVIGEQLPLGRIQEGRRIKNLLCRPKSPFRYDVFFLFEDGGIAYGTLSIDDNVNGGGRLFSRDIVPNRMEDSASTRDGGQCSAEYLADENIAFMVPHDVAVLGLSYTGNIMRISPGSTLHRSAQSSVCKGWVESFPHDAIQDATYAKSGHEVFVFAVTRTGRLVGFMLFGSHCALVWDIQLLVKSSPGKCAIRLTYLNGYIGVFVQYASDHSDEFLLLNATVPQKPPNLIVREQMDAMTSEMLSARGLARDQSLQPRSRSKAQTLVVADGSTTGTGSNVMGFSISDLQIVVLELQLPGALHKHHRSSMPQKKSLVWLRLLQPVVLVVLVGIVLFRSNLGLTGMSSPGMVPSSGVDWHESSFDPAAAFTGVSKRRMDEVRRRSRRHQMMHEDNDMTMNALDCMDDRNDYDYEEEDGGSISSNDLGNFVSGSSQRQPFDYAPFRK